MVRLAIGLAVGVVLAGGVVGLLLDRWKPPASAAARTWRAIVITLAAAAVALAGPAAILIGIIAAIIAALGRPSRRPSARPSYYCPLGPITGGPGGRSGYPASRRSAEDDYWDQRARGTRTTVR
jgi:hypothetical protein